MGWVRGHYRRDGSYVQPHYRHARSGWGGGSYRGGRTEAQLLGLLLVGCAVIVVAVVTGLVFLIREGARLISRLMARGMHQFESRKMPDADYPYAERAETPSALPVARVRPRSIPFLYPLLILAGGLVLGVAIVAVGLRGERPTPDAGVIVPAPTDPEFTLHEEAYFGDIGVRIDSLAMTESGELTIVLRVRCRNPNRYGVVAGQSDRAVLTDDHGNTYSPAATDGQLSSEPKQIRSDDRRTDTLAFARPLPGADRVLLTLDASRYGGAGRFRFAVPKAAWASVVVAKAPVPKLAPVAEPAPEPVKPSVPQPDPAPPQLGHLGGIAEPVGAVPPPPHRDPEPPPAESYRDTGGEAKQYAFPDGFEKWAERKPKAPTVSYRPVSKAPPPATVKLKPLRLRPVPAARTGGHYDLWRIAEREKNTAVMDRMVESGDVVLFDKPVEVVVVTKLAHTVVVWITEGEHDGKHLFVFTGDVGN